MNTALAFLRADLIGIKSWFEESTFSKLFVLLGFFAVFTFIFVVLYAGSDVFFSLLSGYNLYGKLVAQYIIHAAIIIVMVLSIASSFFSTITLLFRQHSEIETSLVLPVHHFQLIFWIFTKSVIANMILFSFIFFPILFAFNKHFEVANMYLYALNVLFITFLIVLLTNAIGSLLAFFSAKSFARHKATVFFMSLALITTVSIVLLKSIFPTSLYNLYVVQNDQFMNLYNSLPLSNPYLPTGLLTKLLTDNISIIPFFLWIFATFAVCYFCLSLEQITLKSVWLGIQNRNEERKSTITKPLFSNKSFLFTHRSMAFISKDLFSILRTPQEAGYSIFLILISLLFFVLISQVRRFAPDQTAYRAELLIFSFVWLFFFTTAFFLRTVFPLVSKEGSTRWHLLTQPIKSSNILIYKIITAFLLSIPFLIISSIELLVLKIDFVQSIILFPISFMGILLLSLISSVFGALFPNYKYADEPEKVSTSMTGLLALFISLLIAGLLSFCIYLLLKLNINGIEVLGLVMSFTFFVLGFLFIVARFAIGQFIEK